MPLTAAGLEENVKAKGTKVPCGYCGEMVDRAALVVVGRHSGGTQEVRACAECVRLDAEADESVDRADYDSGVLTRSESGFPVMSAVLDGHGF